MTENLSQIELDFIEKFIAAMPGVITDRALRDALTYVIRAEIREWAKAKEALSHTPAPQ